MVRMFFWGFLLVLTTCGVTPAVMAAEQPPANASRGSVEVRFLANEGFLLRTQDVSVLIDAFVSKPYSIYGAVPDKVLQEMFAGGVPFHLTRLALVSHIHQDHLQAEVAALFLQSRPDVVLASSPQVIEAIIQAPASNDPDSHVSKSLVTILPELGEAIIFQKENVQVEVLRLTHGSSQHADIEHLGHIIHMNGQRILHIGDAKMDSQLFEPYNLAQRNLDVALIPYWFFLDEQGQEIVEKHLRARYQVAIHIPIKELADIMTKLKKDYPDVHVFQESMQFNRY